jgi:hypothetical protein
MGAAVTKNTSNAVSKVANYVNNSTTTNTAQVNNISQNIITKNCTFLARDDIRIQAASSLMAKNDQIVESKSNTNLNNDIQQKMLQEASSTVGSMGLGYAESSNTANMTVESTSDVVNAVNTAAKQFNSTNQNFICNGSVFKGKNIDINFSNTSNFLSKQTVGASNMTSIINKISQTAKQKATAKVEGMAGFLIALAVLVAAFGYTIAKPLTTGPFKIIIVVIIVIVLGAVGVFMYLKKTPPLFDEDQDCVPNSALNNCDDCVNLSNRSINLKGPPLKYSYGILPKDNTNTGGNLLQMAVSASSGSNIDTGIADNGGYKIDVLEKLEEQLNSIYDKISKDIGPNIPAKPPHILINPGSNPNRYYYIPVQYRRTAGNKGENGKCTPSIAQASSDSSATSDLSNCPEYLNISSLKYVDNPTSDQKKFLIASLNDDEWGNYLKTDGNTTYDSSKNRKLLARLILSQITSRNIDLNIYLDDDEIVLYNDDKNNAKYSFASNKDAKKYCYKYTPKIVISNISDSIPKETLGTLEGMIGVCNNNNRKIHVFFKKIGIWISLGLIIILFLYIGFSKVLSGKNTETKEESKF